MQVIEDQITARFSKDEIVHGNSGKNLPRLFGKPRLIRLLRLILTLQYMDRYNLAAYSSGNLKGILSFPKMDQKAVEELEVSVESQLATFQQDKETGERTRPNRMLWLGTAELPSFLNTMPPSKDMQSLDWYKFYRESIAAVYSVTPVFVSIVESGRTGNNPAMQIDVQNRATSEWQQGFEEPWNNQVLPAFGITDWQFKFNDVEQENVERDARILLLHGQAANVFAAAGFTVTIDEEGKIEVSGQATRPVAGAGTNVQGATSRVAASSPSNLSESESVFVTGDGPCPWCGEPVVGDDPSTHHTHNLSKMAPPLPAAGHGSGGGQGAHHSGGGKRRQVSLLKQAMPQEYDTYVEPFAGSASLFFALDPPPGKSVLNDIDPEFAEVWNWIKTATSEQVQDLQGRKWTATRDEFFAAKAFEPKTATDQIWKNVYVARFSFRRNRRSWRGSDASTITGMPDWLQNIDKYRKQLENAEVTVGDWKQTVKVRNSPTTFFYIDPPYDDQFVKDLLEVLPTIKGKWLLSFGYHPDLQEGLAKAGFNPRTVTVSNMLHGGASPVANLQRQELIAANYPLQLTEKDLIIKSETPRKRYVIDEYS